MVQPKLMEKSKNTKGKNRGGDREGQFVQMEIPADTALVVVVELTLLTLHGLNFGFSFKPVYVEYLQRCYVESL